MRFQYVIGLLLFISLAIPTQAIDFYAPERVPAFTPFTFQALLPATENFTQTTLTFDGRTVATIYPSGNCQVDGEWIAFALKCDTFDADPKTTAGMTLVFTHTGFSKGLHTIMMQSTGPQSENQTVQLEVFDAVAETTTADLNSLVHQVQESLTTLQNENVTVQENTNAAQAELGSRVDQLQVDLSNTKQTLQQVQEETAAKQDSGFAIPFGQPNNSPSTGLVTGNTALFVGIGVLIVLVSAFLFWRGQNNKGFGGHSMSKSPGKSSFFEGNLDAVFKSPGIEERAEAQPRKFASLSGGTTTERDVRDDLDRNPPGKISFGDLIKDERE
ncbi:MAG: hypothetical protein IPJ89_04625 [Candidatus Iainarchaeum archaeon]|uniref:Uncharacterized protein n=1 Tax=Candidatus Iainarchaeum sp. TaxID=3101447 RepID=A0A7T9DJI5_9ARCH|nr:MAG: hypothetical protein IPJ89_04625 [Candidatus Diapherotrites archaeon]